MRDVCAKSARLAFARGGKSFSISSVSSLRPTASGGGGGGGPGESWAVQTRESSVKLVWLPCEQCANRRLELSDPSISSPMTKRSMTNYVQSSPQRHRVCSRSFLLSIHLRMKSRGILLQSHQNVGGRPASIWRVAPLLPCQVGVDVELPTLSLFCQRKRLVTTRPSSPFLRLYDIRPSWRRRAARWVVVVSIESVLEGAVVAISRRDGRTSAVMEALCLP